MKNIKEPLDVDFVIAPSVVTEKDFALVREAITAYKAAKNKKLHLKNLKKQKVVAEM